MKNLVAEIRNMQHCAEGDTENGGYGWYSERGDKLKTSYHKGAKKILKTLAEDELGLTKDQYDLRTNKAGPACLGETTLHTDRVYVQIGGLGCVGDILIRSVKHRKDYTGGMNNFQKVSELTDWSRFVRFVKAIEERGGSDGRVS